MRRALWMTVGMLLLLSSTAHASLTTWWSWLEELSGPGPFHGVMVSISVACWRDKENLPSTCALFEEKSVERRVPSPTGDRSKVITKSLEVSFPLGPQSSGDNPRLKDLVASGNDTSANHEPVHAWPVNATFLFRPHQSIDIGPGMGVVVFSGKDVHAGTQFVLIPVTARLRPLLAFEGLAHSRTARVLCLELHTYYFTHGFSASDFGTGTGSAFISRPELRAHVGISIDIGDIR